MIDVGIVVVLLLGVFAEARRGLFLALVDVLRIAAALALAMLAYSLAFHLSRSYTTGLVAFAATAIVVVLLVPPLVERLRFSPKWARTFAGRVAASGIGLGIGFLICVTFLPVLGGSPRLRDAVASSTLAQPLLEAMPLVYYAADDLNLELPMLNTTPVRFEDEGDTARPALVARVNYSRLAGATCIECGSPVHFDGYFRRLAVSVSPRFTCPVCGRRSDGCQTFEGFHKMYHRCPVDVARELGPIDCGVWPNDRPVYPRGVCPVCGKSFGPAPGGR